MKQSYFFFLVFFSATQEVQILCKTFNVPATVSSPAVTVNFYKPQEFTPDLQTMVDSFHTITTRLKSTHPAYQTAVIPQFVSLYLSPTKTNFSIQAHHSVTQQKAYFSGSYDSTSTQFICHVTTE